MGINDPNKKIGSAGIHNGATGIGGAGISTQSLSGPSADGILLETSDYILLETGDYLLLE